MATQRQRRAARRNVKTAPAGAESKQTLKTLPSHSRTALGREAAAVRRGDARMRKERRRRAGSTSPGAPPILHHGIAVVILPTAEAEHDHTAARRQTARRRAVRHLDRQQVAEPEAQVTNRPAWLLCVKAKRAPLDGWNAT
jgi:hypothetical protein